MSEPNLASSALAAGSKHSDDERTLDTTALHALTDITTAETHVAQHTEPLKHYLDTWAAEHHEINAIDPGFIATLTQQAIAAAAYQRQQWEQEQALLRAELRQAQSLSHEQIERIRHLEQALDQSLASLSEMRLQVVDQQRLEAQLAATEDISNIQQQAIVRLKLQLAHQQQALDAQLTETQARDRSLQTLLNTIEALTQAQQQELQQLRHQIANDRTEVQAYQQRLEAQLEHLQTDLNARQERTLVLETQSLDARALAKHLATRLEQAHAQVSALSPILSDRQVALMQLEAELQQAHITLQEQQALLDSLQQIRLSNASTAPRLSPTLAIPDASSGVIAPGMATAHAKIAALEAQATKQTTAQAMLRHACQELEEERDRQQARVAELENQTTDMQEQILQQAQQASEYETAIQHWKDRCLNSQREALKLKALLEQAMPEPPAELSQVLAALLAAAETTDPSSPTMLTAPPFSREPKVDLPDFLIRRRNYKTRRS